MTGPIDEPFVVVGRGILGSTVALRLAHARHKVIVVGGAATQTNLAFGWLAGHRIDSPLHNLLDRLSRAAWAALLDIHLGREGYLEGGCLKYAADESAAGIGRLNADVAKAHGLGYPTRTLQAAEVAALVPALRDRAMAGALQPDDAVVDSAWAARKALQCAVDLGAELRSETVESFERLPSGQINGVVLSDGSVLACRAVILAAGGKGNRNLGEQLGLHLPTKGVWGVQLRTRPLGKQLMPNLAMIKRFCKDTSSSAGISFGQFPDTSFVINEKFVDDEDIEARLTRWLNDLSQLWPELRSAKIAQLAKTVRWVPPDNEPICGFAPMPNSNVYVLSTNSDGVTMSALMSDIAVSELCSGPSGFWSRFSPGRFAAHSSQPHIATAHVEAKL